MQRKVEPSSTKPPMLKTQSYAEKNKRLLTSSLRAEHPIPYMRQCCQRMPIPTAAHRRLEGTTLIKTVQTKTHKYNFFMIFQEGSLLLHSRVISRSPTSSHPRPRKEHRRPAARRRPCLFRLEGRLSTKLLHVGLNPKPIP